MLKNRFYHRTVTWYALTFFLYEIQNRLRRASGISIHISNAINSFLGVISNGIRTPTGLSSRAVSLSSHTSQCDINHIGGHNKLDINQNNEDQSKPRRTSTVSVMGVAGTQKPTTSATGFFNPVLVIRLPFYPPWWSTCTGPGFSFLSFFFCKSQKLYLAIFQPLQFIFPFIWVNIFSYFSKFCGNLEFFA